MKKIGVFTDRWLSGGIESYLVSNFEKMDLDDILVSIITTRKLSQLYDSRLENIGIPIIELFSEGKDSEITRTVKSLKVFEEVLKAEKFDVLHLNIYNGVSLVYSKLARDCGVKKIIAHSHNSALGQVRLRAAKQLSHIVGKLAFQRFATDYWACSDLAGKWLFTKRAHSKVLLLNNGIDTDYFRFDSVKRTSFRQDYNLSENDFVLGNIGRLNNQKNQIFLLEVARELNQKNVSFTLLIAGDGELLSNLKDRIIDYRLSEKVKLIGTIGDTASFYSGIDIFLLPSLFEGNPIVGIEAQCSGAKCLLSDSITRQAKVNEMTEFLSIHRVSDWVNFIEENKASSQASRLKSYHTVKDNDFDIVDTSIHLKTNLLK
ncbi:glycosyltransferase [Alkalibacterium sp. m-11]|uniref:Glycosyltransferase n=1 Tax=Alkalibacterium indicireducens TaxID=398758 RepID=A0ABN1AIR0_9LACT